MQGLSGRSRNLLLVTVVSQTFVATGKVVCTPVKTTQHSLLLTSLACRTRPSPSPLAASTVPVISNLSLRASQRAVCRISPSTQKRHSSLIILTRLDEEKDTISSSSSSPVYVLKVTSGKCPCCTWGRPLLQCIISLWVAMLLV